MLSHSPRTSPPSSGTVESHEAHPAAPLTSTWCWRERRRLAARMSKPGSSTRAVGRASCCRLGQGCCGSAELLGCHVLQGDNTPSRAHPWLFGSSFPPRAEPAPGAWAARSCVFEHLRQVQRRAQGRAPPSCSGSEPWPKLGPCSRDEVFAEACGHPSGAAAKVGRRGRGVHQVRSLLSIAARRERSCSSTRGDKWHQHLSHLPAHSARQWESSPDPRGSGADGTHQPWAILPQGINQVPPGHSLRFPDSSSGDLW